MYLINLYTHVILLDPGQLGVNVDGLVVLGDVDSWRPLGQLAAPLARPAYQGHEVAIGREHVADIVLEGLHELVEGRGDQTAHGGQPALFMLGGGHRAPAAPATCGAVVPIVGVPCREAASGHGRGGEGQPTAQQR
jgi:hypothetical protein